MSAMVMPQQAWKPSAADLSAGLCPLWWTVGPSGTLAVLFVDRRHLKQIPYIKGWLAGSPTSRSRACS
jgi:hypothetical protein